MTFRATLVCAVAGLALTAGPEGKGEEPRPPALGRSVQSQIQLVEHTAPAESAKPKTPQYPKVMEEGTSASAIRKVALTSLPLDALTPEQHKRVSAILKNISFFRRLPTLNFAVHPDVYAYFTEHPEAAVSVWRAMKISKVELRQTDKSVYDADVGDGSTGVIEVLHQTPSQTLVICDGHYKSPLSRKPIETRSLVLLKSSFSKSESGMTYVTHRADVYVSFPSATIDMAAKIFSPLAVSMTDATFSEISLFLKMMTIAMVRRPEWVEGLAEKMDGVQEIRKQQLVELTSQVHTQFQKRAPAAEESPIREASSTTERSPKARR